MKKKKNQIKLCFAINTVPLEVVGQAVQLSCFCVCIFLSPFEVGNVLLVEAQSLDGNYFVLSLTHNFMPPGGHYRILYI